MRWESEGTTKGLNVLIIVCGTNENVSLALKSPGPPRSEDTADAGLDPRAGA